MKRDDCPPECCGVNSPWQWWWTEETDYRQYDDQSHTTKLVTPAKGKSEAKEWKARTEFLAWAYELARRHDRKRDLPPFPNAEEWLWGGVEDVASRTKIYRINDLPISEDLDIWDDRNWSAVLNVQWNLSASDKQLSDNFLRLIDEERRARGIFRPKKKGPQGKSNRHVPWRWPEVLDKADFHYNPPLGDTDRSILSRARQEAAHYFARLEDFLSPS